MVNELFERGKDKALNEHAEEELKQINEALHAIDEDTYGICSVCGVDIPFERLEAVPTTDRCMTHANEQSFTRDHPIEEEVFSPRSEEHTSELQSRGHLVCRLLLEKKN